MTPKLLGILPAGIWTVVHYGPCWWILETDGLRAVVTEYCGRLSMVLRPLGGSL